MHLYIATRGHPLWVNQFTNDMSAQYAPYFNASGALIANVQVSMRPIQLFEVVFPEQALPNVLKTMGLNTTEVRKDIAIPLYALRKSFGAKKVPKMDLTTTQPLGITANMTNGLVGVYPIGIREDKGRWGPEAGPAEGCEQL